MLRPVLSFLLSLTLTCPPLAGAHEIRAVTTPADTAHYFTQFNKVMNGVGRRVMAASPMVTRAELREKIKAGVSGGLGAIARSVGHNAHTLMLLWLLGGVEAIRQQEHLRAINPNAKIRNPETTLEHAQQWWETSMAVGEHMINSLELVASLAGGGVAGTAGAPVVHVLQQLVTGPATRPMLAQLMAQGTGSFFTFVGFEHGHQLIEESIFLLEEEDIKVAKELKFYEVMRGRGTPEQRAVFAKIMANAYDVLTFAKPDVLLSWVYNTWRLRMGTGEFVTMLSAMVTAGVAAGTLIPGAGWIVGLLVGSAAGFVGGLAAILLPHHYKQPITDGIRRSRTQFALKRLYVNETELKRVYRALGNKYQPLREHFIKDASAVLRQRANYRGDYLTALFEQLYDAYLRMQEAGFILEMINKADGRILTDADSQQPLDTAALKVEFTAQLNEGRQRFNHYYEQVLQLQRSEVRLLAPWVSNPENFGHPLFLTLDHQVKQQETIHHALRQIYAGLMPEKLKEFGLDQIPADQLEKLGPSALVWLNVFRMRTFMESDLLE